jgi:hypothetical protein
MKALETLEKVNALVQSYEATSDDAVTLIEIQKDLTCNLYYLENERAKIYEDYQTFVFNLVKTEKTSVANAKTQADVSYPELYQLRRVMDAAYKVVDAIRTHISFLKAEMHHTKMN